MKVFFTVLACLGVAQATEMRYQIPVSTHEMQQKNGRIVNGTPANPGQFPYQVLLNRYDVTGNFRVCGGSIISNEWILTSGGCLRSGVLVEVKMGLIIDNEPEYSDWSTEFIIHPYYNSQNFENNIGLIRLSTPIHFSENIQPVALPSAKRTCETFVDNLATVSGWGRISAEDHPPSPRLNWAYMLIISNSECRSRIPATSTPTILESMVCVAGWPKGNEKVCNGDQGGALTIQENGKRLQIGVVSFTWVDCFSEYPTVYTRITHFRSWIQLHTGM